MVTRGCAVLATLAALFACESATMPGHDASEIYSFAIQGDPPLVYRWPLGAEVRVLVLGGLGERAAVLSGAFTAGANAWNGVALWGEYRLVRADGLEDADVVVTWSDFDPPIDFAGCPRQGANAVTTFCMEGDGLQVFPALDGGVSRVTMVVTISASPGAASRVRELVAHELGHVLGIGAHSPFAADLMWGSTLSRATPAPRDAATMRVLYHTRPDLVP